MVGWVAVKSFQTQFYILFREREGKNVVFYWASCRAFCFGLYKSPWEAEDWVPKHLQPLVFGRKLQATSSNPRSILNITFQV